MTIDAFIDLATQATLSNLMDQLKLLTNQLLSIQLQNDDSKANDFQVYPTVCGYCNGPNMSIDFQMEDPFAQDHPP